MRAVSLGSTGSTASPSASAQTITYASGGLVLVVARYVPGGRTAATFTCGITRYPYARFAGFDAIAAVSWAVYASALGYFGGRFFHDHAWVALLVAFAIAGLLTLAVEGVRRLRNR